jgi:hypothetical protein
LALRSAHLDAQGRNIGPRALGWLAMSFYERGCLRRENNRLLSTKLVIEGQVLVRLDDG